MAAGEHLTRNPSPLSGAAIAKRRRGGGLDFKVAWTKGLIIQAWQLVYTAYLRTGLISENEHEIHTLPLALQEGTCVAVGVLRGEVCATISAYADQPAGLPLDSAYRVELDGLRQTGHQLVEVGLLADRRAKLNRSLEANLSLMKYAFFWGKVSGATDLVVGVHPHHRRFYERIFGFKCFGSESTCPSVNDAPVIPLRLPIAEVSIRTPLPRGIRSFLKSPYDETDFERRFAPTREAMSGTIADALIRAQI